MASPPVREERTGWRDEGLSRLHRSWGWDCPCIDIDFVLVEFNLGIPYALVEYKHEYAAQPNPRHPSYTALRCLANRAFIPFYVVTYSADFTKWRIDPFSELARQKLNGHTRDLTQQEWVSFLYRLQGRELPPGLF